jgi:CRISPR system Cascade subunit CasA
MTMNLTIDPWIPVERADGSRELISLQDLFAHARELHDLAVKPHERIALMRLLLCITHAALDGPRDAAEWQDCQPLIQPRVRNYLETWRAAFELFGEGLRFLQLPNLQRGKTSDEGNFATKLDLMLSTGNNPTLFDNRAGEERSIRAARAAINLLTFQNFSPCGRIGVALWNGKETPGKGASTHAPCTSSSMIHTFLLGSCMLETLHLNLLNKDVIADAPNAGWGKPIWELPVTEAAGESLQNARMSYLGRLVPLSRAIRLNEDGISIILANGLDYPVFPAFREGSATIIKRKEELGLLSASSSRSLWRQLPAITIKLRSKADSTAGTLALNNLPGCSDAVLWVGALIAAGNGKIVDVVESTYSLPAGMFSGFPRAAYKKGVAYAEEREGILIQSVKSYASTLKATSPAYAHARQQFWTRVEQHLADLFDLARKSDLAADLPNCSWGKAVKASAFDAYEQACPRQTPRQIQAYVLGLRKLTSV